MPLASRGGLSRTGLEANLALVDAEMATIDEIFLPYLHIQVGGEEKTLFEHYKAQERAALLPGS